MPDTHIEHGAISLSPCQASPGAHAAYGAPLATPCPVLTPRVTLSAYAPAAQCPVLTSRMVVPGLERFSRGPPQAVQTPLRYALSSYMLATPCPARHANATVQRCSPVQKDQFRSRVFGLETTPGTLASLWEICPTGLGNTRSVCYAPSCTEIETNADFGTRTLVLATTTTESGCKAYTTGRLVQMDVLPGLLACVGAYKTLMVLNRCTCTGKAHQGQWHHVPRRLCSRVEVCAAICLGLDYAVSGTEFAYGGMGSECLSGRATLLPFPGEGPEGSGFRVQGSGFRVQGSGFRVQGSGFRVQGSGFRVQGSGFRI
eukprot:3940908-Rhodomonas_salina.4